MWGKILGGVLGAIAACYAGHSVTAGGVAAAATGGTVVNVAICIGVYLVGLFQTPPTRPPASPGL